MRIRAAYLLLPFIFCAQILFAQESDVSALLNAMRSSKPDTGRTRIYIEIADHYKLSDPDSSYYFVSQGIAFASSIDDKKRKAKLLEMIGALDMDKTMYNKALQDYTAALDIHKELKDGYAIASNYASIGRVAISKGEYPNATDDYLKALKIFEERGDTDRMGAVNISLGMICEAVGENRKALNYLLKAQDLLGRVPFSIYDLQLMNDLGMLYHKLGDHNSSISVLRIGIAKSADPKYAFVHAQLLANISAVLYDAGHHKEAIAYMQETLHLAQKMGFKESECYALVNLAETDSDPRQALAKLKDALAISKEIASKYLEAKVYESMADFYKKNKRYAEALDATDRKNGIRDSIANKQKSVEMADLESTYELERSNNKINNLMLLNSKDKFKTKLVIAIASGIGMILIIGVFYYRRTAMLNTQLVAQHERLVQQSDELKGLNNITVTQKEELNELNTVKDKIFSVIGHDMRSPIGNIISMLQMMEEEGAVSEEYRPYMNDLRLQSLATLDTLDKLLYWGKNSVKGIVIQQQVFTVDAIIKGNIDLLIPPAQQKNISVANNVPAGTQVFADVSHFDLVTRNLLSNALKFTPTGGSINIGIAEGGHPGFVVFAVHDTGIGMSQEEQDHIFSLDATSKIGTQEEVGTGIGLLLCKEFIEKNGGELWVTSKPGEGSTFYFSFKAV